ncbi:MAG TPA: hypothetical protein VL240_09900 [Candidatus Binatia bacterium]|nr:hypothetical protein [Candidatus Binatia bacterium]
MKSTMMLFVCMTALAVGAWAKSGLASARPGASAIGSRQASATMKTSANASARANTVGVTSIVGPTAGVGRKTPGQTLGLGSAARK